VSRLSLEEQHVKKELLVLLEPSRLLNELQTLQSRKDSDLAKKKSKVVLSPLVIAAEMVDQVRINNELSSTLFFQNKWDGSIAWTSFYSITSLAKAFPAMVERWGVYQIVARAVQAVICRSLVAVSDWLLYQGPNLAGTLMAIHESHGLDGLQRHFSKFAGLVDHIVRHISSLAPKPVKSKRKRARVQAEDLPTSPADLNREDLSHIPADFYGLCSSPSSKASIPLPLPAEFARSGHIGREKSAIYEAAKRCLMKLWEEHLILPHMAAIDDAVSKSGKKQKNGLDSVRDKCIVRGRILAILLKAFDNEGIFSSDCIATVLDTPIRVLNVGRLDRLVRAIEHDERSAMDGFKSFITGHITKHPEAVGYAKELGKIVHHRLLDLHVGSHLTDDQLADPHSLSKSSTLNTPSEKRHPKPKNVWENGAYNHIDLQTLLPTGNPPKFDTIAVIIREALADRRKGQMGSAELQWLLQGRNPFTGASYNSCDKDQFYPIRAFSPGATLLKTKIPPSSLTKPFGISNLLAYMGTGQGPFTSEFLSVTNFPFQSLEDCIKAFEHGELLAKTSEGDMHVSNARVYGTASNFLGHRPTVNGECLSLEEKFSPYFTDEIQSDWQKWLGEMAGQDPAQYRGNRRSWLEALQMCTDLKLSGFKTGLTAFQFANNLVLMGVCSPPSPQDMANWIFSHPKLGAAQGLCRLGFSLSTTSPKGAYQSAFLCTYNYLDRHLTEDDKALLDFGPIFLEHLLCKVHRWTQHIKKAGGDFDRLAKTAVDTCDSWASGLNKDNCSLFPLPMCTDMNALQISV
jgi:hypothetical protein